MLQILIIKNCIVFNYCLDLVSDQNFYYHNMFICIIYKVINHVDAALETLKGDSAANSVEEATD